MVLPPRQGRGREGRDPSPTAHHKAAESNSVAEVCKVTTLLLTWSIPTPACIPHADIWMTAIKQYLKHPFIRTEQTKLPKPTNISLNISLALQHTSDLHPFSNLPHQHPSSFPAPCSPTTETQQHPPRPRTSGALGCPTASPAPPQLLQPFSPH